jgi:hypothetical protein
MCSVLDLPGVYLSSVEGFAGVVSEEQINVSQRL